MQMSKKILAAVLAVLMVIGMVPVAAGAVDAPKEVIAANLTYRDGFDGPAFGQATEYKATLTKGTNGANNVKVTATDLVMSVNPDSEVDPARATYQVGVGILIPEGNNIWANKQRNSPLGENSTLTPDDFTFWPNADPYNFRQVENGKNYATFYTQGTIAELNAKTMYISTLTASPDGGLTQAVLNTRRDYVVTFDVSIPATKHTLTVTQAEGGTIAVKSADVAIDGSGLVTDNELVRVTATPETDKKIQEVTYSYTESDAVVTKEAEKNTELAGEFTFNMPKADTTVTAVFVEGEKKIITVDTNEGGTVTVDAAENKAVANTLVEITVTPASDYDIEEVYYKVDSGEKIPVYKDANGKYTFAMPDSAVNVGATFTTKPTAPTNHTITTSALDGGTITVSPEGPNYTAGQQISVTVTPDDRGKKVASVKYNTESAQLQAGNTYIFIMPDNNVTVTAEIADAEERTITVGSTVTNGRITYTGTDDKYYAGDVITVTVTPNSGYAVDTVTYIPAEEDPVTIPLVNGAYSFTMPDKNVKLNATFVPSAEQPVPPPITGPSGGGTTTTPGTITTTAPTNGTLTTNVSTAKEGDKVTVTVKPNEKYQVVTGITVKGENGNVTATKNADGTYSFTMPKGSVTVSATIAHMYDLFTDVPKDIAEYGTAIKWAVEQGITLGTSTTTFSPYNACTRAQMVVFLYRAAGSPAITGTNKFTDLPSDSEIQKAVQWAVSKGITKGTSDTTFAPYDPCTRSQMVTFLHRNHSEPAATGTNKFVDVPADAFYKAAVQWAVDSGVTKGTSDTTFDPTSACTRVQMVTFLYRDMGKK